MPYIESRCIAGKTIEIEKYYSSRYKKKGISRSERKQLTREEQKKVNSRQAEKKLRRILNANFGGGDLHVVLDYRKDERPATKEEMKEDFRKFIRKLRGEYKKAGKELKYVNVMEVGSKGARHHHIVLNEIDVKIISKLWEKGRAHYNPLDETGQYKKLASYLIKYTDKVLGTEEEIQGRRWGSSKNLIHPEPVKRVISDRNCYREEAREKKGYYVDKETIAGGIHDYTGYPYFTYTLVKLDTEKRE